jgi:site-specific DNA recombinase
VWKAIITPEQRRQVHALLAQKQNSGRRTPRRYLLSGLLRCGKCGHTLYSAARENSRRYVCSASPDHGGCGRLTVVAPPVEALVAAGVLHRLDTPALADALAGREAQDTQLQLVTVAMAGDQAQLAELADAYGNKLVTMREWLDARKPIEARIANAGRQLTRSTHGNALAGLPGNGAALTATWDTLNLTRQAAIISAVLDHALIAPGVSGARSLDPARVHPVWRL